MRGWVRIDRGIQRHPLFAPEPFTEREAWLWLILNAEYRDKRRHVAGQVVTVPRGSLIASYRDMQRIWRWNSWHRVRNFLSRLCDEDMIALHRPDTARGKTVIEVMDYERYQAQQDRPRKDATAAPDATAPAADPETQTHRENLLAAMGLPADGMTAGGRLHGNRDDMLEARRWADHLGLSEVEQVEIVRDVMQRRTGDPPRSFRFFTPAMQEAAGRKAAPKLQAVQPTTGGRDEGSRRPSAKSRFKQGFLAS